MTSQQESEMELEGKRALIFAAPLYEEMELHYPLIRLREAGARVVVAGLGEATYTGKHGLPIACDAAVADVDPDGFDAVVIPGGFAPDKLRQDERVLEIVRSLHERGRTIAFICHAGWVPVSAGILRGKRATSVKAIKDDMVNAGAVWVDEACVVDGNLVSARTPADLPVWMPKVVANIQATAGQATSAA